MAKHNYVLPLLALLIACGAPEAATPADVTDEAAPDLAAEPSCSDLDESKCQITSGCAWSAEGDGCKVDKAGAFAP